MYSGVSVVVGPSVHMKKNSSEEVDDDKAQETTVFVGHQKFTSALKLRPEK